MNSWFQNLRDPEWWMSSVMLVIVVNLASSYLKPFCDGILWQGLKIMGYPLEKEAG